MSDDNLTRLPDPGVVINLDTLERDPSEIKPPFKTEVNGRVITFLDPAEIDWKDLAAVQIPADLFSVAIEDRDDRNHLREAPLPGWKFNKLMESYYVHYDFEEKIRAAKRQAQFSGL